MTTSREDMLGRIRGALGRGELDRRTVSELEEALADPKSRLVPARGQLPLAERLDLFTQFATAADTTVARVPDEASAVQAVGAYLREQNLPAQLAMAPDPTLDALPWDDAEMLEIERRKAEPTDEVSVTGVFCAVAETGTLMLRSGPDSPTTLNLLPETHVVVLWADQVVGPYEDAWARLRAARRGGSGADGHSMPRTVNFVTGPSRSGDIEQVLQLGAHGPRRLHVVLIDRERTQEGS